MNKHQTIKELVEELRIYAGVCICTDSPMAAKLVCKAVHTIEEMSKALPKWISATERLPDFEGSLLCMRKTVFGLSVQEVLYYEDGEFSYNGIDKLEGGTVTHWMPLPKPPKDGA